MPHFRELEASAKVFDERSLVSMMKEHQGLPEEEEEKEEGSKAEFENVGTLMEDVLGKKVEEVIVSARLMPSSCCISEHLQANVEQIMKVQALCDGSVVG